MEKQIDCEKKPIRTQLWEMLLIVTAFIVGYLLLCAVSFIIGFLIGVFG